MTPRDEQIAEISRGTQNLRLLDRLGECYTTIRMAYASESVIDSISHVIEAVDRRPSDFKVLSNSETRRLTEFNDVSYHWDHFCNQLGRSVAHGERTYLFEMLEELAPRGQTINPTSPSFTGILDAIGELNSANYQPDAICMPISLLREFMLDSTFPMNVSSPKETLDIGGGQSLAVFWSSGLSPLNSIIVFDSTQLLWKVKPDPATGTRLTVAIGEPSFQPGTVRFIAETIVHCEILDQAAFYSIPVQAEDEGVDQG